MTDDISEDIKQSLLCGGILGIVSGVMMFIVSRDIDLTYVVGWLTFTIVYFSLIHVKS